MSSTHVHTYYYGLFCHALLIQKFYENYTVHKSRHRKAAQHIAFPTYDEEDILNSDAAIVTRPPRPSGTIRVKLVYEEPSKPIPVENP